MTSFHTTCSYCNAIVHLSAPPVSGQRIPCPRCGESFPYVGGELRYAADAPPAPPAEDELLHPRPGLSNRTLATLVVAGMTSMALITVIGALNTVDIRRAHDLGISKPQEVSIPLFLKLLGNLWVAGLVYILFAIWRRSRSPAGARPGWLLGAACFLVVGASIVFFSGTIRHRSSQRGDTANATTLAIPQRPAEMATLTYVPADSNVIVGIQVRKALRNQLSKQFLEELRAGPLELGKDHIEKWTGLKWEEMDELALALKIDGQLVPRPTLVIRSRQPLAVEAILKKLSAERIPEANRAECYRIQWGRSNFKPTLWCPPDSRTVVISLTPADIEASAGGPREGIEHIQTGLRALIQERIQVSTPIWAAVASEEWDKTILTQLWANLPAADRAMLWKVRALGIWLDFNGDATVNVAARCTDDAAAGALRAYLQNWTKPVLPDALLVTDGSWVAGQAHGDFATVRRALDPTREKAAK